MAVGRGDEADEDDDLRPEDRLEGRVVAPLARGERDPGQRGYGALGIAALTGVALASREWSSDTDFQIVLWTKVVLFVCLVAASYLHNFVLGPRLQGEIRDGREPATRPTLVVVGWISYALTVALPILGVALDRIVN